MTAPVLVTMESVRRALAGRLEAAVLPTFPGAVIYWDKPHSLDETPAIFLAPDRPFANPTIGFGGVSTDWVFLLTIYADFIDEEGGQQDLDQVMALVFAACRSDDYDDTLQQMTNGFVQATAGVNYDSAISDYTNYLSTQIRVMCRA